MSTRVVLVKPGDVLIFGNVGDLDPGLIRDAMATLRKELGLAQIVLFPGDIDLAAVPATEK